MDDCRTCAHDKMRHTHHRAGTDCGTCGCTRFARRHWWNHYGSTQPVVPQFAAFASAEAELTDRLSA